MDAVLAAGIGLIVWKRWGAYAAGAVLIVYALFVGGVLGSLR